MSFNLSKYLLPIDFTLVLGIMDTTDTTQTNYLESYNTQQEHDEQKKHKCSTAFTIGAFVAGIGIGIYLATSRREELAALAENIHSGYDKAKGEVSKAGSYVNRGTSKLKFW